jgi:hypothetical protein
MAQVKDAYKRLEVIGIVHILKKNHITIPKQFFDKPEPIKEIVKFLRDNKGFTFEKIGKLLDKTPGAILTIYTGKK